MPTISVIVPVYNVEPYIHRCVDSILAQTFTDFELILVDDGSPDNCGVICDEYAAQDERVRVIHKENGGVSSARNAGLDCSNGSFVTFCDADDKLFDEALAALLYAINENQVDMIIGGMQSEIINYNNNTKTIRKQVERRSSVVCRTAFSSRLSEVWKVNNMLSACGKLYRRDLIERCHLRFDIAKVVLEDCDFVLHYLESAERIMSIDSIVYTVCGFEGRNSHLHRSKSDYADDVLQVNCTMQRLLTEWGIQSDTVFWNAISGNFGAAIDSIWCRPARSLPERIKKHKRLDEILRKKDFQRYTKEQRSRYSSLEYLCRLYGCSIGASLLQRIRIIL